MAPIGKLYGSPRQPQTKAILSAAAISGLEIDLLPFEFGIANKSPDLTGPQNLPLSYTPAFEDNEGFKLIKGTSTARYVSALVPKAGLLGHDVKETAQVDQWVHFASSEIYVPTANIYAGMITKDLPAFTEEQRKHYQERAERSLKFLDDHLASRSSGLLVNDSLTLADIILATAVQRAGQTVCGVKERERVYRNVFAHFEKVTNDERIKHLFGEPEFVDKALSFKAE
ncbi:glutathione S-transferase C-terminal-like protein [Pisolithus croceorrhizus]|nr:glutathione S-transferase C-terminal-like protein [Pisolithus croceorrhizus]KAI6125006.1 glutathione S-transferase C-terminal-like protein [Pisolithus croceorrhizus]KAI6161912.1 glutathione S-transferase C-terminal-like protein [Pisolithus thermaeus]